MKKLLTLLAIAFFLHVNAQYTKLLDFNVATNGSNPYGDLLFDGTFLYGTTAIGGASGNGTIFKIKPDGTGDTTLFTFNGTNGKTPQNALYYDGIYLYGITNSGGADNAGTIFKIKPDGTGFTTLLNFDGSTYGDYPNGSLVSDGVFLYGTTLSTGGSNTYGTVFKIKPNGTGYVRLHTFTAGLDGVAPYGALFYDGTFLYGYTIFGGINNGGILYKIKPDSTGYTILNNFSDFANGPGPTGSVISDGTYLYGMRGYEGATHNGTIFKIKPDGSGDTTLYTFTGTNGRHPLGSLVLVDTFLYGMTYYGGVNDSGVIFKIKTNGTGYIKLLDFSGPTNGSYPMGSLTLNGSFLYGMTHWGGVNNQGVIFKYNAACSPITYTQSLTVCAGQSVIVGINTYTTSGTYTNLFVNGTSTGCDSTVITNLIVLPPNTFIQAPTICNGQSLTVGTSTYTTAGTYTNVLPSIVTGCDSTITTHLTVLSSSSASSQTLSICSGQSLSIGTDIYTSNGTYTYTFQGNSCDSVVITTLVVNPNPTVTISGNSPICVGQINSTTLTASGGGTYLWNTGSANTSIIVSPTTNTIYSVIATIGTCTDTALVTVMANGPPNAGFNSFVSMCCASSWGFMDTTHAVSGDPIIAWNWTFSGGYPDTSSAQNPSVSLPGGNHIICLTVTTQHGCKDSTCEYVFSNSIKEFDNSSITSIYPNPVSNNLTISCKELVTNSEIQITDILGNKVKQDKLEVKSNTAQINVGDLLPGVYFLHTNLGTQKFIKE